jgi:hypothetical protein
MWCVAELNEDYIAKMEDVLEIYERPYSPQQPVVCLDEKPVTLHADVRPFSAAKPRREARRDNEYERRGTANVFCAVEPKAGRHFTFPTPNRSAFEFARVIFERALQYPDADTIHLVLDNLNIHRRKSLTDVLGARVGGVIWDRFTVDYTPTHASWAQPSGSRNRHLLAPIPRHPQALGSKNATLRIPSLEPPHKSRPHQNQLAVRPKSRSSQVRLSSETF